MDKKLLFTVTNDLVYDQRMQRICSSLVKAGYEVTLVGRKRRQSPELDEHPFRQVRLTCRFEKGKLFYLEYNLRLFWWLLWQPADALCAIDLDTLLPVCVVGMLRNKKRVYDAHEYFTETPEVERRGGVKRIWEWVARIGIPRMHAAYTVGPELGRLFSERYGIRFRVVRNVPEPQPVPEIALTAEPRIILYQGVLNEGRGLEYLLEAMTGIEGAELWLAGEGDLSDELRALAKRLQLSNKVRFLGYLRPSELRTITPRAYLGVNLLEARGLSYYYSLANKAFDYIQAGVPSLQMDFPEYRKLEATYGVFYLLPDLEVRTLVGSLRAALADETTHLRKVTHCRSAARQLNWEEEQKVLLKIYRGLWVKD